MVTEQCQMISVNMEKITCFCSCQGVYAGFVYTYGVTEPLSLPHKTAGYLASIFWAAITAGRLVSVPLSYRFQPVKLLLFNLVNPVNH